VSENCIVDKSKETHSYEASFVAAFIRSILFKSGKSFSYETVMSHSSKVKELKAAQKIWPDISGNHRGMAIDPLYPGAVAAAKGDTSLY
jgi:hypothetical protein